jgi:hypothetical protein
MITHLQPPTVVMPIAVQRFSPYHSYPEEFGITALQPDPRYSYVYPESRVNLPEIAFHFEHTYPSNGNKPEHYIKPIKKAVDRWKALFESEGIHLLETGAVFRNDTRYAAYFRAEGIPPLAGAHWIGS